MTHDDLHDAFAEASVMPYGRGKILALEQLAHQVPESDLDLAFSVRLELVGAYVYGGEAAKMLVPFSWCVATFDAHPELAGRSDDLLWIFKWVPDRLLEEPSFDLAHTEQVLDDMARRYRDVGHSMHPVHALRCLIAQHVGDTERAAAEYTAWWTSPRGHLSDCEACDPSAKVGYLSGIGDHEGALLQAEGVLTGELLCLEQPQRILTGLLESFTRLGRLDEAADAHRRAYRSVRGDLAQLGLITDHIEFCALTGNEARAVEIVLAHHHLLDRSPATDSGMWFRAAGSLALRRAHDLGFAVDVGGRPGAVVAEEWADEALATAGRFDRRNGTAEQSRLVEEMLHAEPWVDHVPLHSVARRVVELEAAFEATSEARVPAGPAPQVVPTPDPGDVATAELLDRAEELRRTDVDAAVALFAAFEERVPAPERTLLDRGRALDGRALRLLVGDAPESALEALGEALAIYDEAGDDGRVRRVRARTGRVLLQLGRVDEASAVGEQPLRELVAESGADAGGWRFDLAQLLAARGELDEALSAASVPELVEHDDLPLRAAAAWMRGDLLLDLGHAGEAVDELRAAVAARPEHDLPWQLLWSLGRACLAAGDHEAAIGELVEAAARAAVEGHRPAELDAMLVETYHHLGVPDEVIVLGEECLEALAVEADADWVMQVHDRIATAYLAVDVPASALTHADAILDLAPTGSGSAARAHELRAMALEARGEAGQAVGAWLAAAELHDDPEDRGRALVRAGVAVDDADEALDLWRRAEEVLVVADGPGGRYWEAVVCLERAELLGHEQPDLVLDDLATAQRIGHHLEDDELVGRAAEVRLDIGGGGDLGEALEVWRRLEPESRTWYGLGYSLHEALDAAGRVDEGAEVIHALHGGADEDD